MKYKTNAASILFLFAAACGMPVASVLAQDGSVPGTSERATGTSSAESATGTTSALRPVESVPREESDTTPIGATSTAVTPPTPPRPGTTSDAPVSPPPTPPPGGDVPTETPVPVNEENETGGGFGVLGVGLAAGVLALALAGFGGYALKTKQAKKNNAKDEKDETRCLNLKKLMEEKLREATDVRGQLEGMATSKARSMARGGIKNTPVEGLVATLERAEKEYGRLKQLYTECTATFDTSKRVIIVHGWDGNPGEGWFPWLKNQLEGKGFKVLVPTMPESSKPQIDAWVGHLADVAGDVDEHTYLVGHSIGCQTILRYLEKLPDGVKIGGAIFVAGWFTLSINETPEERVIAKPWLETPIDFEMVKSHTKKIIALFSDDDDVVPISNKEMFAEHLGADTRVLHGYGHFSGGDGVKEVPIVLEILQKIANG